MNTFRRSTQTWRTRQSVPLKSSYSTIRLNEYHNNAYLAHMPLSAIIQAFGYEFSEFDSLHNTKNMQKLSYLWYTRWTNCLLKEVIEGKIKGRLEVTRRRGRRRKKLLNDLGDRRGYCNLKEEALDRIKWRNRFGRGCGPVVWQITDEWILDEH